MLIFLQAGARSIEYQIIIQGDDNLGATTQKSVFTVFFKRAINSTLLAFGVPTSDTR